MTVQRLDEIDLNWAGTKLQARHPLNVLIPLICLGRNTYAALYDPVFFHSLYHTRRALACCAFLETCTPHHDMIREAALFGINKPSRRLFLAGSVLPSRPYPRCFTFPSPPCNPHPAVSRAVELSYLWPS